MADLPPIGVVLTADTSDFDKGMRHARNGLKDLDDSTSSSIKSHKSHALAFAAVGVAAVGAAVAVTDFIGSSIKSAQEAQIADARLGQVAKQMGFMTGAYAGGIDRMNEYSTALMKQIGVDDESIKATQAKLLTFKNLGQSMNQMGGMFDRATRAAYDLAATGFGEASSNAVQLGKALQDPIKGITALGRAGVTFTQQEKDKIKTLVESNQMAKAQEMVMKAIERQVGGTAAATATSTQKMAVSFGELKESIGTAFLPTLNKLAETLMPIIASLQGPLTAVAASLGNALGKAFAALAPVLPVVAEALGTVAGVLGSTLATAITALVPVITPMVKTLGTLANAIGPVLAPLLQKIGTLFSTLLQTLMPLITPLTTLVMSILNAAGPILGVVVDALTQLVGALAPVFTAVGMLITPLGQLINVLFKAIMPILQPLLPVITILANILGDVLTRAIGVLMLSMGVMLQAWGKIAPFLLDNVVAPVVNIWLTMVSKIVEGAAAMFGWVPGLGDKLKGASAAVATFRDDATKAIREAGTTVGKEGEKLGKSLMDNGLAAIKDPASVMKAQQAGAGVGAAMVTGMAKGITDHQATLSASARQSVFAAEAAARDAAQSKSPSKLFAMLGGDLVDGIVKGMEDKKNKLTDAAKQQIEAAADGLKTAMSNMKDFGQGIADTMFGWLSYSDSLEKFTERQKAAADTLAELTKYQASLTAEATDDQKAKLLELQDAYQKAQATAASGSQNVVEEFLKSSEGFAAFGDKMMQLLKAGLNKESFKQIFDMGAERGGQVADAYLNGNTRQLITQTNATVGRYADLARVIGEDSAVAFDGAGVKAAVATMEGIIKEFMPSGKKRKQLMSVLDGLAADMSRTSYVNVVTRNVNEGANVPVFSGPSAEAVAAAQQATLAAGFLLGGMDMSQPPGPGYGWVDGLGWTTGYANGGYVSSTAPALVHAGEFVLSRDMLGGKQSIPREVQRAMTTNNMTTNQPITVNAVSNADPFLISREIAWAIRTGV